MAELQLPPLKPVTSMPSPHIARMSSLVSPGLGQGIRWALVQSSTVGAISIFLEMYVLMKYCFTSPFSMTGPGTVATPSESNRREPDWPLMWQSSMMVRPSLKTFCPRVSAMKELPCWSE